MYYGPHPSTWAIVIIGAHQPGGPRAPCTLRRLCIEEVVASTQSDRFDVKVVRAVGRHAPFT